MTVFVLTPVEGSIPARKHWLCQEPLCTGPDITEVGEGMTEHAETSHDTSKVEAFSSQEAYQGWLDGAS